MAILGDVRVSSVEKTVFSPVAQFKQNVSNMVRRILRACWRRIRQRMVNERLTGPRQPRRQAPPGAALSKRSGDLIRSMGGFVVPDGDGWKLDAQIGRGIAGYDEIYEKSGRLQFRRVAQEEIAKAQEEIREGFAVLSKVRAGAGISAESQALIDTSDAVLSSDAGRNQLLTQARQWVKVRRAILRDRTRARRAKTSGERAFRSSTRGFGSFGL
jgi:hypothetical protein